MIVIAGAAGAGKTTVCRALAGEAAILVLDGDVVAGGAHAVASHPPDYEAFWRYVRSLAAEVQRNRLTLVIGCVCLPAQLVPSREEPRLQLDVLALVADEAVLERRREQRNAYRHVAVDADKHRAINDALRVGTLPQPHRYEVLDTTALTTEATTSRTRHWVRTQIARDL